MGCCKGSISWAVAGLVLAGVGCSGEGVGKAGDGANGAAEAAEAGSPGAEAEEPLDGSEGDGEQQLRGALARRLEERATAPSDLVGRRAPSEATRQLLEALEEPEGRSLRDVISNVDSVGSRPAPEGALFRTAGVMGDMSRGRVAHARRRSPAKAPPRARLAGGPASPRARRAGRPTPTGSASPPAPSRARPAPLPLDPNGRFATTYRPGRGHLARLETAMLRSLAPEGSLALVGDAARSSGPPLAAPRDRALALHVASELGRLPPGGGAVHLALTLRSTAERPPARPSLAVHLLLDTSGSMSGEPVRRAREAAERLVGLLEEGDRVSVVTYGSDASVVVPAGPVGGRRSEILAAISAIQTRGATHLEAGLRTVYDQARRSRRRRDEVQLVVVISDGQPNQGETDPWELSELSAAAFQGGVESTAVGVGERYDATVMAAIAEGGAGGYYYVPDAAAIEQVLRAELEARSQPVARGVELRIRLGDGVELLQAYGSRRLSEVEASRVRAVEVAIDHDSAHHDGIDRDRGEDRPGGMRFFIPGFARDDEHTILLRLRAPPGAPGRGLVLAEVELRYKDRLRRANGGDEDRVAVSYASSAEEAAGSEDRQVRRAVLAFRSGLALAEAADHVSAGDRPRALALLHERSRLLRAASERLGDAALRAEADRLEGFRAALAAPASTSPLLLGALARRASTGLLR